LLQTDGYASDDLDEPDEEEEQPKKKRKLTKAQETKAKAAAKKAAKKKKGGDDDDFSDEDEDSYNALSKALRSTGPKPSAGSFADCAKCNNQFTVVRSPCFAVQAKGTHA
jgi:DNA repair protein RAD7